jgi:hypothetical protein
LHERATGLGQVRRQHGQSKQVQAKRLDHRRALVRFLRELRQDREAEFELAKAREEETGVVSDDMRDGGRLRDAKRTRSQQVAQRLFMQPHLRFAEALQPEGAGMPGLTRQELVERITRVGRPIQLVEHGADVPQAFVPLGLSGHGTAIERERLVQASRLTRLGGLPRERVERCRRLQWRFVLRIGGCVERRLRW